MGTGYMMTFLACECGGGLVGCVVCRNNLNLMDFGF